MRELLFDWYDCNGTSTSSPSPSASEFSALLGEEPGRQAGYMRVAKSLPRELLQVVAVMPDPRIASSARLAALKSGVLLCSCRAIV